MVYKKIYPRLFQHVPPYTCTPNTHSIKFCAVKFLLVKFVFLVQFNLYWIYKYNCEFELLK